MDAHPTPADAQDRLAARMAAGLLAAVAAYCLARGLPWPNVDDPTFLGAGIDLARTGQLVNHGIDAWLTGFGTTRFYVQLPFSVYSMALWFRLAGINTAGLLVFQWGWCLTGLWGLVRTLGRFGVVPAWRLLLAALYLLGMLSFGLRPEPEAAGLLFLGLSLLDSAASFRRRLGALVLLGSGCLSYPIVLALAAPFGAALAWLTLPPAAAARGRGRALARAWVVPAVLAAAVTFLVFLAMIRGDLRVFLAVFNAHRRVRADSAHPFAAYFQMITQYHEAVLTLPVQGLLVWAAVWVAWRWRRVEPGPRALVAACAVAAVGCILLYAVKAAGWIGLLAFFAAGAVLSTHRLRRWRYPLTLALAALYVGSHALPLLDLVLRRFPDPAVFRAAREAATVPGKSLLVNYSTARYVFGYRLPPGTRYAEFTPAADRRPDEIRVVTALSSSLDYVDLPPPPLGDYPRLRIGGHEFRSVPSCPDAPLILP